MAKTSQTVALKDTLRRAGWIYDRKRRAWSYVVEGRRVEARSLREALRIHRTVVDLAKRRRDSE